MNRSKKLYILLGILFLLCIAAFGVSRYEEHKELIQNSDKVIIKLDSSKVKSLSWEYGQEKLDFHKDENWLYDKDEDFPVNEEKINELLEQFKEFGVSFIIKKVEDYGQYGLDKPVCTIKIKSEDKDYEILLGDYSKMDSERYVSIGDGNVYLVKNDPMDYFDLTLDDMAKNDEIPEFENITEIQFTGTQAGKIIYEESSSRAYCAEDVYFMEQDGEYLPLDTSRVNNYLDIIRGLDLSDYVTYKASDKDLKEYGLDKPAIGITVKYTTDLDGNKEESNTFVLSAGRKPENQKAKNKSGDEEAEAYIRAGNSEIIYRITSDDYEELMEISYNDLRHKEVFPADFDEVYKIDISLEGTDYTITSKIKGGKRVYYYGEEELGINSFRNALEGLKADSFTSKEPSKKEEASFTLYLDNKNYPEINIGFYRYNGSYCIATVDGKPVSFVGRSGVIDLTEAVNAFVLGSN